MRSTPLAVTHQLILLPLQLTTRPQRTRLRLPRVRLTQLRLATRLRTTQVALLEHQEPPLLRTTLVAVLLTLRLRVTQLRTTLAAQQARVEAQPLVGQPPTGLVEVLASLRLRVGQPPTELAVELAEQRPLVGLHRGQHIGLALPDSLAQGITTKLGCITGYDFRQSQIFTGVAHQ